MSQMSVAHRELLEEFMAEIQESLARLRRLEKKIQEMLRQQSPESRLMP